MDFVNFIFILITVVLVSSTMIFIFFHRLFTRKKEPYKGHENDIAIVKTFINHSLMNNCEGAEFSHNNMIRYFKEIKRIAVTQNLKRFGEERLRRETWLRTYLYDQIIQILEACNLNNRSRIMSQEFVLTLLLTAKIP